MNTIISITKHSKGYQATTTFSKDSEGKEDIRTTYKKEGIEIEYFNQNLETQSLLDSLVVGDDAYPNVLNLFND